MDSLRKSLARNKTTATFDQLMECWVYGFKGSKAVRTDSGAWFFTVNLSCFWGKLCEKQAFMDSLKAYQSLKKAVCDRKSDYDLLCATDHFHTTFWEDFKNIYEF